MKTCPKCQKEHEKTGIYCSRTCSNSRTFSPEAIKKKSAASKKYFKDPEIRRKRSEDSNKYWQDVREGKRPGPQNYVRGVQEETIEKFKRGKLTRRILIYKVLVKLYGNYCFVCPQLSEWNGKPLRMRVDHVDGDASNNLPGNLRLICPNCDSQLPTYAGGNKGFGRVARGIKLGD